MKTVHALDLPGILKLLRLPQLDAAGQVRAPTLTSLAMLASQWSAVSARPVNTRQIMGWLHDGRLPIWAALPLLSLFGVACPGALANTHDGWDCSTAPGEHSNPESYPTDALPDIAQMGLALFNESTDAFCARVRIAGGAAGTSPPGSTWDQFLSDQLHCSKGPGAVIRVLPAHAESCSANAKTLTHDPMPGIRVLSRVAFEIRQPPSLLAAGLPVHWYLFHDVRTDSGRHFVPLLPLPFVPDFEPAPQPVRGRTFSHPVRASASNCFVIPERWGPVRRIVGVASTLPFGRVLLHEAQTQWAISASRIDLLAARLLDNNRVDPRSFEVCQSIYAVQGG